MQDPNIKNTSKIQQNTMYRIQDSWVQTPFNECKNNILRHYKHDPSENTEMEICP